MAYAPARSCNAELNQGAVDGSYKQFIKDRGGVVDHSAVAMREDLDHKFYAINEAGSFTTPDDVHFSSPYASPVEYCPCCGGRH
jgi:hypothetical protein